MKKTMVRTYILALLSGVLTLVWAISGFAEDASTAEASSEDYTYEIRDVPLEREGISLHLDRTQAVGDEQDQNILLIHGLTYSTHEYDLDYEDYSLVRFFAREGYTVWRLDIAGYGQSEEVEDGFLPDSDYAGEDINAAVEKIVSETGEDKIDVFAWSWGTVTSSRFAVKHPEHLDQLILCAPILCGLGEAEVTEDFHHNTWESASDDFQRDKEGNFDYTITDPVILEMYCSSCWHYDGESSPNGGRRDLMVDPSEKLIDLDSIQSPTLVICGDKDPYLNYDLVDTVLDHLPENSGLEIIPGAAHALMFEAPYHQEFQDRILSYLKG